MSERKYFVGVYVKEEDDERYTDSFVETLMDFRFTEVKAKIYAYLRKVERATAEGIAKGAGIYITSVRGTIAEMYQEGWVIREKVKKSGVGKPAFVYEALAPDRLVKRLTDDMNNKLEKLLRFAHRIKDEKPNEN